MNELFEKLGINWPLFAAQLLNFFLLFLILRRFLFRPLQTVLNKRTTDAQTLLAEQQALIEKQRQTQREYEELLKKGHEEAKALLAKTLTISEQKADHLLAEARLEIERIQKRHEENLQQELLQVKKELTEETVSVAMMLVAKVLKQELKDGDKYEKTLRKELEELAL